MATRTWLRRRAGWSRVVITWVLAATVALPTVGYPTSAHAEDPEAVRRDLIDFAESLARLPGGDSAGVALRDRVVTADSDVMRELTVTLDRDPGWPATKETLRSVAASLKARAAHPRAPVVEPGAGAPVCDADILSASTGLVFGLITARSVLEIAAAGVHAACDINVAGFNSAPACVTGGIIDALIAGAVLYLDLVALCQDELESLANAAAIETQDGMARQLDALETKLDDGAGATERIAERQLEKHLRDCDLLVSLALPREFGGDLEDVRALVEKWLLQAQLAAVGDIPEATKRLQRGNQALETDQYRAAYRSYCLAYRALLPRGAHQ